jgi:hypothetical protein
VLAKHLGAGACVAVHALSQSTLPHVTPQSDLLASADAAVGCLGVGPADHVLVVYNDEQSVIAESLAAAAKPQTRAVTLLAFPTLSRHGEEPPADVAEAMLGADVVIAPTSRSLSQTQARIDATRRGVRIATLPTITEEIFARASSTLRALSARGRACAASLSGLHSCDIRSRDSARRIAQVPRADSARLRPTRAVIRSLRRGRTGRPATWRATFAA